MSRYKKNGGNRPVEACGSSTKSLKEDLKYLNIAILELVDLIDNGYIGYQQSDAVYGDLMSRKRHIVKQIKNNKKGK